MSDFQDAFEAGRSQSRAVLPPTATPLAVLVDGDGDESIVSLEQHADTPTAKRGLVQLFDETSFCAYVNDHRGLGTRIFADIANAKLVAVLDHHDAVEAGWGRHRAELVTRFTPEWGAWLSINRKRQNQVDFAEFIENHIAEIADPTGAQLLEMVQTLEVKRNVEFANAVNLTNGQTQLVYHENVDGTTQKGTAQIPKEFLLGITPFETDPVADKFRMTARLRYRLESGRLVLWIDLVNPEKVLEGAFRLRVAAVEAGTSLIALRGEAPAITAAI